MPQDHPLRVIRSLAKVALGTKRKAQGVLFLMVVAFLVWLSAAFYNKTFITVTPVTLEASHTGTQLSEGADVKLRGIIVGEVRGISTTGLSGTPTPGPSGNAIGAGISGGGGFCRPADLDARCDCEQPIAANRMTVAALP